MTSRNPELDLMNSVLSRISCHLCCMSSGFRRSIRISARCTNFLWSAYLHPACCSSHPWREDRLPRRRKTGQRIWCIQVSQSFSFFFCLFRFILDECLGLFQKFVRKIEPLGFFCALVFACTFFHQRLQFVKMIAVDISRGT